MTHEWFNNPECKKYFVFIRDYHTKYQQVPSAVTFTDNFPTARLQRVKDDIHYLLDQFLAHRTYTQTYRMLDSAVGIIAADPNRTDDALSELRKGLADIDTTTAAQSSDVDLTSSPLDRFAEYQARQASGGALLGYPTGFATIDQATEGLQGGQLVSLVASPKVGKSTLMVVIAAHLHDQGHSVMLQSFEMSNREQQERHDAIRAKVSLKRLRKGTLTPAEEQRYQTMLGSLTTMSPLVLSDSQHGVTVSALAARVARLDPDVVFVDGVYFMIDEVTGESGTAQSLTSITRALKRVAQRLDKPIVLSTQALLWKMRKGKTSEGSIGYSSSFLQDSDVILGLDKEDGVDDRRTLKIIASRNCPTTEVDLDWDWDNGRFVEQTSFVPGSTSPSSSGSSAPAAPTDLYGLGT